MAMQCTHLNQIKFTKPSKHVCEECIKMGDSWVHLRMCLECGKRGLLRLLKEQARDQAFSLV